MSVNTTAPTYTAGAVLTAANLNTVADGIQAAWDTYTPTWAATSNPAVGNGTLVGKYLRIGKMIQWRVQLTMGSTTTYGSGNWVFSTPFAAHANYTANMAATDNGIGLDVSAPAYNQVAGLWVSSTTIFLVSNAGAALNSAAPWAWAVGDKLSFGGTYEAA